MDERQPVLPGMPRQPEPDSKAHGRVGLPYSVGSGTSKAAAESMVGESKNQRQRIWEHISRAWSLGQTSEECEVALGMTRSSCSTRVGELRTQGRIRKTGAVRETRSGCSAAVYQALAPMDWADKRPGWPSPEATYGGHRREANRLRAALRAVMAYDVQPATMCADVHDVRLVVQGMRAIAKAALEAG
jgi:hypothetical protein